MNTELIRNLESKAYEVATLEVYPQGKPYGSLGPHPDQVKQKFVELIIQECCARIQADWQKVEQTPVQDADFATLAIIAACRTECVAEIKQHWGMPS